MERFFNFTFFLEWQSSKLQVMHLNKDHQFKVLNVCGNIMWSCWVLKTLNKDKGQSESFSTNNG
jgi:hypothetical protein